MVQIIENRADVDGTVVAIRPVQERLGFHLVTLDVKAAAPVEGYQNLFAHAPGERLDVLVPEVWGRMKAGDAVRCRIRLAAPKTIFAEQCTVRSQP